MAKRLMRWQLSHEAPAPLALEHPVQEDLAAAADEIERLSAPLDRTIPGHEAPLSEMLEAAAVIAECHLKAAFGTNRIDAMRAAARLLRAKQPSPEAQAK